MPRSVRVILALMLREMRTTYGKSSLGYLWAIIEPIGAITVLSLAFSVAFENPALGSSFPLFYATGYIPFMVYNTMQNQVGATVRENIQLLFYPRVTYMDAIISRFILISLTQFLSAVVVFTGIFILDDVSQRLDIAALLVAFLTAAFLGLGMGVLNCVIIHLMPSWRQIWSILTRPLFLISCIFFMFDTLPDWVREILWWNPIIHIVGLTRVGFYSVYEGDYIMLGFPLVVAGSTLFLGLALLRRHAANLINS